MSSKLEKSKDANKDRTNFHTLYPRGRDVELFENLK